MDKISNEDVKYASLAINWRLDNVKTRQVYVLEGIGAGDRTLCTNAADVMTTCAAILERMIYAKRGLRLDRRNEDLQYKVVRDTLGSFKTHMRKYMRRHATPCTPEQFVDSYKGRKKTMYANNLGEYYDQGVKRFHSYYNTFMKVEKVPWNKSPRTIQPRHPVFNIGLGRYLKPLEKEVYKCIAKCFGQDYCVMKGLNMNEVGAEMKKLYDCYDEPVAVGIDASRFDASITTAMLKYEHSFYLDMYSGDSELARLLKMQLKSKGTARCDDGTVKYTVSGGRGSGDMNTALGNCLIMCSIIYCWSKVCGVNLKLANNGDDCVVFMEKRDLQRFSNGFVDYAKALDFYMEVEPPVYEFEEIEFCQAHPILVDNGWRMVRNIDTAREKDSMCLFRLDSEKAVRKWLFAVGECGLSLCSGIPVMQAMYKAFMREGVASNFGAAPYMERGALFLAARMESKEMDVSDETRSSFFTAFDVTPDEQTALEAYYDNWSYEHVVRVKEIDIIESAPF